VKIRTLIRASRLLIPLTGATALLTAIVTGANIASAPASAAPSPRSLEWRDPPGDPEIGGITLTGETVIISDTATGGLTRTVFFNNKNAGIITATVAVTGTPTLALTGGAAFSNTVETMVTSTAAPFEGDIAYVIGTNHGDQPGVLFTATNTNSLSVSIQITFVQDITAPTGGLSHPAAGWVTVTAGSTLPVTGTADDAGAGVASVQVMTGTGGLVQPAVYLKSDKTWVYTWTMPSEDGVAHILLVTITDHVGNALAVTLPITTDNVGPGAVDALTSTTHITGRWSNQNTVTVTWGAAQDGGSGLAGYATVWDSNPTTNTSPVSTTGAVTSASSTLADGTWYFHIRARDALNNWSDQWRDLGPFMIDMLPPVVTLTLPAQISATQIVVCWQGNDPGAQASGVASYTLAYQRDDNQTWLDTMNALSVSATVPVTGEHTYTFTITIYDRAGNSNSDQRVLRVAPFRVFVPAVLKNYPPPWEAGAGLSANTKVYAIAACTGTFSSTVYAGTDRGVYKSTNAGASWTLPSPGLGNQVIYGIAAATDCQTVYAATWGQGVYKSTNGGANWSNPNEGLSGNAVFVTYVALNPSDVNTIYAATAVGVYKSTNGGISWSSQGLSGIYVLGVSIDPQQPQTVYAATRSSGIYKTTNGGGNWTLLVPSSARVYIVAVDPHDSNHLLAATTENGVLRSTDGGANWTVVGSASKALWVAADLYKVQFWAGYDGLGVHRSTDGQTWAAYDLGLIGNSRTVYMVETGASYIYAGTGDRAWRYPRLP